MSVWKDENVADKVVAILKNIKYKDEEHHLGNPYLTSYQLAIEFSDNHPDVVAKLPFHDEVGGEGLGERNSLAQYLGNQLSGHSDQMRRLGVEGGFLSGEHLVNLEFKGQIKASVKDVSIFRYNPDLLSGNHMD